MTVIVRFAPSPTGKLHVGNVRAALWNWLFARKEGGRFILRIDDTDRERSTRAYEEGIKRDLEWLGLFWDETFRQSERFGEYDAVAEILRKRGLLYPCYETPEELERKRRLQRARGLPPVYDRAALQYTDEQISAFEREGRRPHWRFRLSQKPVSWNDLIRGETTVDTASVSDPVLVREDGVYLYTLPSCIDDVDMGITHVIRGEDHVTNAAVQIEIMQAVIEARGKGAVPAFAHHSLLVGADGQGLSKRLGALSIEAMREDGLEPAAITSLLARLGTADPVTPERDLMALAAGFDFARLGRAPARFDPADLDALNAKILHAAPYEAVADRLAAFGVSKPVWEAVKGNIARLSEAARWRDIVEGEIDPVIEDETLTREAAGLVPDDPLDGASWDDFVARVQERTGAKGKKLFMPLRLALTGEARGPEMAQLFPLIGAEKARARLSGRRA
ncbi:glutamate--tRNA ligase [Amphiplicatus metriothermophilus]|uniref:Glutamate--tRNA ligase n=1 Tax=Amphiplicatus metriothermophilus TaxID=1519374 RepID=A0A239PKT0_9PROT|nr:glutamate--tRNA ligase [Amphiplicatus metriothermophilus]MBB5517428.1 glutamyl-tRNA synthetase [Amphiplicatus metriothermophilus]SNT68237.1 glutamyl-tRNA synthetase [Amphiplicatus metriothermophilus]